MLSQSVVLAWKHVASAGLVVLAVSHAAMACPFCTVLKPTLAQLRESAAVVALAEVRASRADHRTDLRLHQVLRGAERLTSQETLAASLDLAARPGSLLLIFGKAEDANPLGPLAWHAVPVNETSYAYFVRDPALKTAHTERLRYFARFLEHADRLVAQDAYLEFGHAPFDDVARVAAILPMSRMRAWLVDPNVPQDRKGFYGLALGLATTTVQRQENAAFLLGLIVAPEDDFRAGFDGVLGGYLLASGELGLRLLETRYFTNRRAADGDVRHALTALRFYHEYGREVSARRLGKALRPLLDRPEFAAAAITDLARWGDWDLIARVEEIYARPDYQQPAIRRAVVGYLLACPQAEAAAALVRLRKLDASGVAAAEMELAPAANAVKE